MLPGLKMAGYWDADSDQDWGLPWHRNEGIELTLLEEAAWNLQPMKASIGREATT